VTTSDDGRSTVAVADDDPRIFEPLGGSVSPSCLGCAIWSACASAPWPWRVLFRLWRPAVLRPGGRLVQRV